MLQTNESTAQRGRKTPGESGSSTGFDPTIPTIPDSVVAPAAVSLTTPSTVDNREDLVNAVMQQGQGSYATAPYQGPNNAMMGSPQQYSWPNPYQGSNYSSIMLPQHDPNVMYHPFSFVSNMYSSNQMQPPLLHNPMYPHPAMSTSAQPSSYPYPYSVYPQVQQSETSMAASGMVDGMIVSAPPEITPNLKHSVRRKGHTNPESQWRKRYNQLIQFKQANGHCNVPQRYSVNLELGRWVKDQRTSKTKGMLSKERTNLLNEIGFSWRLKNHDEFFDKQFKNLVVYKDTYGDCNVPISKTKYVQLARWVERMRRARKNDKLSAEKINKLDSVGFIWSR